MNATRNLIRAGILLVLIITIGMVGDELLSRIPELASSTGAACHACSTEPSNVLLEMGLSRELALGALRLTMGRWSTMEEVDSASELFLKQVKASDHLS